MRFGVQKKVQEKGIWERSAQRQSRRTDETAKAGRVRGSARGRVQGGAGTRDPGGEGAGKETDRRRAGRRLQEGRGTGRVTDCVTGEKLALRPSASPRASLCWTRSGSHANTVVVTPG